MIGPLFRRIGARGAENYGKPSIYWFHALICLFEFVAGLVAMGLYLRCMNTSNLPGNPADVSYGAIVGALSSVFALIFLFPQIHPTMMWVFIVCAVLTITNFTACMIGVAAHMKQADPGLGADDAASRMHHVMYVEAAAAILWTASTIYMALKWNRARKANVGMQEMAEVPDERI